MNKFLVLLLTLVMLLVASPADARRIRQFRPYTVVEITPQSFVLENRVGDQYELERSRWPGVKIGETIYYDKKVNRLFGVDRQRNKYEAESGR
jgi:hypothetical protein